VTDTLFNRMANTPDTSSNEPVSANDIPWDDTPPDIPFAPSQAYDEAPATPDLPLMSDIIDSLNPDQKTAVMATEGPVLVLAGAGTGKTRVLTTRIAHIMDQGLVNWPSHIMAVTFTNKAAREMRLRIEAMVGAHASSLWLGTFHSIALRMLRQYGELLGFGKEFTIIDTDDQIRLIKTLCKELNIDDKKYPPRVLAGTISGYKDKAMTPHKAIERYGDCIETYLYRIYQDRLKQLGVMDFGDLLLHGLTLLTDHAEVRQRYQNQFQYILVDEYQDTNVAQYLWLRLLAQEHTNICCVGDDDQSIYGWRGAEVDNILRFGKDFNNATIVKLECNYRSTQPILDAANALIACNRNRLGKQLYAHHNEGTPIEAVTLWDERAEAHFIADAITTARHDKTTSLNEMAILVRAGHQTRPLEECFLARNIPYRVIGGLRFYERLEIRDTIAYIRATIQPMNDLALERIINVPRRGVGGSTLEKIRVYARDFGISMSAAIRQMLEQGAFKGKQAAALSDLMDNFTKWHSEFQTNDHSDVVANIINESGYKAMWKAEKTPEAQGRVENLDELVTALKEFDSVEQFLEYVALVTESDSDTPEHMVSIMTMHGAKGLEFDMVFLAGWEEGLFPSQRAMDESGEKGLEEERRLAYVGITRARKNLTITTAANRFVYGETINTLPSRFIDELPANQVIRSNHVTQNNNNSSRTRSGQAQEFFRRKNASHSTSSQKSSAQQAIKKSGSGFTTGQRVFHQKFGYGKVIDISGTHITVAFEKSSTRTLLADYLQTA